MEKANGDQLFAVSSSARIRGALKARGKFKKKRKRNASSHSMCLNSEATLLQVQKQTGQTPGAVL